MNGRVRLRMRCADLSQVPRAKVPGTWALRRALVGQEFGYFRLFSSGLILRSPLRRGYAAGNAFLDGLTTY